MKSKLLFLSIFLMQHLIAAPRFVASSPDFQGDYRLDSAALCATAKQTVAYLNKGASYDPQVIHDGKALSIPLTRMKATLLFICQNQAKMNDPAFIKQHFEFIRWYPDVSHAKTLATNKSLLRHLPDDRILMTKYYVHLAKASAKQSAQKPYALYGLPADEQSLTLEEAEIHPELLRFHYGKQAILAGALKNKSVPELAYLSRDDLESALLQGTVVADFGGAKKTFNVHRNNNIAYNRTKNPYQQERYWYFKQVDGIKGYGKDADHKITVNPEVTFAADLNQFGLGKLLLIQYRDPSGTTISKAGIFADTGGAFADNLYQVDYLAGSYAGREAFSKATRTLPDYVAAYFMVLK
jgi:membrane-bound lytic murein transglycosylase